MEGKDRRCGLLGRISNSLLLVDVVVIFGPPPPAPKKTIALELQFSIKLATLNEYLFIPLLVAWKLHVAGECVAM
jgi:hypothetical protein